MARRHDPGMPGEKIVLHLADQSEAGSRRSRLMPVGVARFSTRNDAPGSMTAGDDPDPPTTRGQHELPEKASGIRRRVHRPEAGGDVENAGRSSSEPTSLATREPSVGYVTGPARQVTGVDEVGRKAVVAELARHRTYDRHPIDVLSERGQVLADPDAGTRVSILGTGRR